MSVRYGTNTQNTSKYMEDLLNEYIKMPHGVFDETRRKIMDVTPYAIHPVECWEMLPGSDAYLQYDIQLLSKNPTIKRLLSSMKVELRTYKVNYNDCWKGWNNFITKGRSGKVSKSIPYVDLSLGSDDVTTSLPYNPMHSLSIAPSVFLAQDDETPGSEVFRKFTVDYNSQVQAVSILQTSGLTGLSTLAGVKASTALRASALPFVFYNKIVKQFLPPNLLQDNPHWYPEDENDDQILPYSATGAVTTSDYSNPTKAFVSGTSKVEPSAEKTGDEYESYPWLNVLQYAQRKGDYFNTGSPFPDLIRGDIPTIQALGASINWDDVLSASNKFTVGLLGLSGGTGAGLTYNSFDPNSTAEILKNLSGALGHGNGTLNNGTGYQFTDTDKAALKSILSKASLTGIEFSASMQRYLMTMTVLKERLALTDGSYNGLVKAMFGHNPNWHNHEAIYCGGYSQPIVFSEVVNQTESDTAPLGDTAGRAVSASTSGTIHVHSDDFGMFMTVLVITPDEYYSQGADKMWTRLENAEQYLPILNNLSPDATKNKELYISGTNNTDEDVFNHQERFAYYKSRRNQVSGLMSLPIAKIGDVGAWLQNRLFGSTPQFNTEFNRGNLTDNEKAIFASTNQAQFCAVIGSSMRFVAPIPEDSRPSDMGISY